ncbi:MAG TPA: hypothetical protein PLZ43_13785 [bacterium]|nr:hypothetical protein [bacterium]
MKLDTTKLFFAPIPGLILRPIMESYVSGTNQKIDGVESVEARGEALLKSLMTWKDKDKAEKLFFENTSLEGYGKLNIPETQEKVLKDFGLLALSIIFAECWFEYLGKSLAGTGDQEG